MSIDLDLYYPEPICCICGNICKIYEIHMQDEQMWCWCEKCKFDTFHEPIIEQNTIIIKN